MINANSLVDSSSIMTIEAGVWIDHKRAFIVILNAGMEETKRIESSVEKQLRRHESSSLADSRGLSAIPADDARQRSYTGHLANYYDEVIAGIGDAKSIFLFGPGEAKGELKKRMEKNRNDRWIVVKAAHRMTESQILETVRGYFHHEILGEGVE